MISVKKSIKLTTAGLAVVALLFSTGCSKEESSNGPSENQDAKQITDARMQSDIKKFAEKIPAISWYNSTMDKIITIDPKSEKKGFDFSSPNSGWGFSSTSGTQWTGNDGNGGVLFLGPSSVGSSTGAGGGSGTVVAGNSSLNINLTVCFSGGDENEEDDGSGTLIGIGGFGGPNIDGVSGVIGISGDFEAMMNEEFNEDSDPFEFFHGLAFYVVYDDQASGDYDILNWFDNLTEEPDALDGDGFAWVYSFSEDAWGIYFSQEGTLNVSGGTIGFSGTYFGLMIDLDDIQDPDGDIFDMSYNENQTGFGTMGCN